MYLPEDIIYHILTCMDDVRTLARATQVCKEWHAICQDVRIWSNKGLESVAIQRWTSLLHWAVAHNCSDLALRLMNMGMKVDLDDCPPDHNGFLHDAARYGHVEMAKVLLDCGCPINSRGRNMFTPLHHACQSGNRSMVTMLLKRGAEVDMRTTNLETPLHLAASRQQHSTLVTTMLDWGANIAVRDKSDWTPLHMAARNGCVENVRILLQRGAEIDAVNKSHTTPLHCAAQYGHLDVVSVLLQGGASVNMIDADRRWTPLQCACTHGYKDIAVMLLEHGACWTTGAGYPVLYEKYRQIKELMEAQGPSVVCV